MFSVVTAGLPCRFPWENRIRVDHIRKDNIFFYHVRMRRGMVLPGNPSGLPWKGLSRVLAASGGRTLLADGLSPPAKLMSGDWWKPPDMERFSRLMLKKGLEVLLSAAASSAMGQTAVLLDWNCRYQDFADVLIRHFRTVQVVTRSRGMYQPYVEQKLYECGAAVLTAEALPECRQAALFVSPSGLILPAMREHPAPVFLPMPLRCSDIPAERQVHSFRAELPASFEALLPEGVDATAFQAALFECCGLPGLGNAVPICCSVCDSWQNLESAAKWLFS